MPGYVSLLVFFLVGVHASAQYPFDNALHFPNTETLERQKIKKIVEGPRGFIWIATDQSLYRFDGRLLKVMYQGEFEDIDVDIANQQFIFTRRASIILFPFQGGSPEIISTQSLTGGDFDLNSVFVPNDSTYWIGSDYGLTKFQLNGRKNAKYPIRLSNNEYAKIRDVTHDPVTSQTLWLGSKSGLFSFDIISGEYTQNWFEFQNRDLEITINDFDCLYTHIDGKIYCGTWGGGLAIFDPTTGGHTQILMGMSSVISTHVYSVISESDSVLWISTTTGTARYQPFTGKIELFESSESFQDPVLDFGPVMIDTKRRYWIGYTNGLRLFDPQAKQMDLIECPLMTTARFYIPRGTSYHEDPNLLYVNVDFGEGLYTYDITNDEWRCIAPSGYTQDQQFRGWDAFWQGDTIWILEAQSIYYYKQGWTELRKYPFDYGEEPYRFRWFAPMEDGSIWVTSNLSGLYIADPIQKKIRHYKDFEAFASFDFLKLVRYLHVDIHGRLWLGYKDHIYVYWPNERRFAELSLQINEGANFLDIFGIHEDSNGIWLPTAKGIFSIQYSDDDNIAVRKITDIKALEITTDGYGDLWITTGFEILKLNTTGDVEQRIAITDELSDANKVGFEDISTISDGRIFLSARKMFAIFHPDDLPAIPETPIPYMVNVFIDGIATELESHSTSQSSLTLDPHQNSVTIDFSAIAFSSQGNTSFRYKLDGVNGDWINTSTHPQSPTYTNLKGGGYRFLLQASGSSDNWSTPAVIDIYVGDYLWQRLWFQLLAVLAGLGAVLIFYQVRLSRLRKKSAIQMQIINLEKKALQAQMNPHFLFNAMNSIQHLIASGEERTAMLYLNKFGKLLRSTLNSSDSSFINLETELEMLENYILLESLRFEGRFHYKIHVDPSLEYEDIKIPGFILQPVVENAIQHGLLPQKQGGNLNIMLSDKKTYVHCTVSDDGVGRNSSSANDQNSSHESKGLKLLQTRLELLNPDQLTEMIQIIDLKTEDGSPAGTQVHIKLPIQAKIHAQDSNH